MSIHKRVLRSGQTRYDSKLRAPDGTQFSKSFRTKKEAVDYEATQRSARAQGEWFDPKAGTVAFADYADQWLRCRPALQPRTVELYSLLLRRHLNPILATLPVNKIVPGVVREWYRKTTKEKGTSQVTAAKASVYSKQSWRPRLKMISFRKNPCNIKGAGSEKSAERPIATVAQVNALVEAVELRFRAAFLLAAWCCLREGEIFGLHRNDLNLVVSDGVGTVRVARQMQQLQDGSVVEGPPKSRSGRRRVAIPPHIIDDLAWHLNKYVGRELWNLVFSTPTGEPLRRSNFNRRIWQPAARAVALPQGFRFHDLRGTGATRAAIAGATLPEIMALLGRISSSKAALRYLHAVEERRFITANQVSKMAEEESRRGLHVFGEEADRSMNVRLDTPDDGRRREGGKSPA